MVDKRKIGEWFTKNNLWGTAFNQFSEKQIDDLIIVILSSPGYQVPPGGWVKPFINQAGELIIPPEAHPKYRYWLADSQSIFETLKEIGAPEEVVRRYVTLEEGMPC